VFDNKDQLHVQGFVIKGIPTISAEFKNLKPIYDFIYVL